MDQTRLDEIRARCEAATPGLAPRTGLAIVLGDRLMTFIADDEGLFRRTVDMKIKSGLWPDVGEGTAVDGA